MVLFLLRILFLRLDPWFNIYDLWIVGVNITLASRHAFLAMTILHWLVGIL